MSEEELIEIAEAVARQRLLVNNLGMMNQPIETKDRVRSDALYMVQQDKLRLLEQGYQAALRQCSWAAQQRSDGE